MRVIIVVCLLALVAMSASDYVRGCRYINGNCYEECKEGTYSYTPGCTEITPEATCEDPNPRPSRGENCDYSACYCVPPTVKNKATGECVQRADCPQPETATITSESACETA